jgi:hypothetical protein
MFNPHSASLKHKLDVTAMLASIRQTRGRPAFRAPSKAAMPCGDVFSFAPRSIDPQTYPLPQATSSPCNLYADGDVAAARGRRSASATSKGPAGGRGASLQPAAAALHPFPFRSPSASPGIPHRIYTYDRSASAGRRTGNSSQQQRASLGPTPVTTPENLEALRRPDVSRRSGSAERTHPAGVASSAGDLLHTVAMRLDGSDSSSLAGAASDRLVGPVQDTTAAPDAPLAPRQVLMRRVPQASLRADAHGRHGRKATVDALRRPVVVVPAATVVAAADASSGNAARLADPLALLALAMPFCPSDVRRKAACLSTASHAACRLLAESPSPARDSRLAVERECQRHARRLEAEVSNAFVAALVTYRGPPPRAVVAMARVAVPLVEADPELCNVDDGLLLWKLLQGHLATTFAQPTAAIQGSPTKVAQSERSRFVQHLAALACPGAAPVTPDLARAILHVDAALRSSQARTMVSSRTSSPREGLSGLTEGLHGEAHDDPSIVVQDYVRALCLVAAHGMPTGDA